MKIKNVFLSLITLLIVACKPGTVTLEAPPDLLAHTDPAQLLFISQTKQPALFDRLSNQTLFIYPEGKLSADQSTYVTSQDFNGTTMLMVYDALTGQQKGLYTYGRSWKLSAVSPNGSFIVMTRLPRAFETADWQETNIWFSDIRVIESATGQVLEDMQLEGNFEVEAIDNKGQAVFMIEHIPAINPDKYRVRFYDRGQNQLDPTILRDKRTIEEFMTGYAWGTVATEDGAWLMTLYMNTARNNAFVHALDLNNRWTFCLNLPTAGAYGDFDKLKQYSIAVTPNNRQLLAANPAMGIVVVYSLENFEKTHLTRFDAVEASEVDHMQVSYVSEDGRFFYFSQDNLLWAYDLQTHQLTDPLMMKDVITGLELEAGQLFITLEGHRLQVVETAEFRPQNQKIETH